MKKFYPPKWHRWLYIPFIFGFWIWITKIWFFTEGTEAEEILLRTSMLPFYFVISAVFLGGIVVMWLQTGKKLPAAETQGQERGIQKTEETKIYMPKWQRWYRFFTLISLWSLLAYGHLVFDAYPRFLFILITLIFVGAGILLWLITSGKIHIGVYKHDKEKKEDE